MSAEVSLFSKAGICAGASVVITWVASRVSGGPGSRVAGQGPYRPGVARHGSSGSYPDRVYRHYPPMQRVSDTGKQDQ